MTSTPDDPDAASAGVGPRYGARWMVHAAIPQTWWPDVLLIIGFCALTSTLTWPSPVVDFDVFIRDVVDAYRPDWAYWIARGINLVGQGFPLAVVSFVFTVRVAKRYRTIRPLLMFGVTYAFVGFVILPKIFFDRVAPHWPGAPPYVTENGAVVFSDFIDRQSYPSGHAVNTIVWYFLIVVMLGESISARWRSILLYVPPVLVFLSQTYLGFHWVSDTPAGIMLAVLIVRVISRIKWGTMPLGFLERYDRQKAPSCLVAIIACGLFAVRRGRDEDD